MFSFVILLQVLHMTSCTHDWHVFNTLLVKDPLLLISQDNPLHVFHTLALQGLKIVVV